MSTPKMLHNIIGQKDLLTWLDEGWQFVSVITPGEENKEALVLVQRPNLRAQIGDCEHSLAEAETVIDALDDELCAEQDAHQKARALLKDFYQLAGTDDEIGTHFVIGFGLDLYERLRAIVEGDDATEPIIPVEGD